MSTQIPLPQIPLPTFEDIRKILNFWFDQQDKWFYFEGEKLQTGTLGHVMHSPQIRQEMFMPWEDRHETTQYTLPRIVGRIKDVVSFPPSLLLENASVFTAAISSDNPTGQVTRLEKRTGYGLVFSQITYYEPIQDIDSFLKDDSRVQYTARRKNEE